MKVLYKGKYLAILPGDTPIDKRLLLGWRQKKNDPWIVAEDNIINRIVLGLPHVWQKDEVKRTRYMNEAYVMGKNV